MAEIELYAIQVLQYKAKKQANKNPVLQSLLLEEIPNKDFKGKNIVFLL